MEEEISGAVGIGSFSSGISYGSLPHPSTISHEGIINDYYFETVEEKEKIWKTLYSFASSKDPLSGKLENFICVNCVSSLDGEGLKKVGRPNLNLTILLDISGSMGSRLSGTDETKPKLDVAKESILTLLTKLGPKDAFCLLTFDDKVETLKPLGLWNAKESGPLKAKISELKTKGGTDMGAGMTGCISIYDKLPKELEGNENRIIILTDADLTSDDETVVVKTTKAAAERKIYVTFIGIGVDFNTRLISQLASVRAQNYMSVKTSKEFKKQMDEEFDYLVTPSVFSGEVSMKGSNWEPIRIYGSPGCEIPKQGKLLSIVSSFPSPKENPTSTKGGVVIVKVEKKKESSDPIPLTVSYEDRKGTRYSDEEKITFPSVKEGEEFYSSVSTRKAVLLIRYVNFMKLFLGDALNFKGKKDEKMKPSVDLKSQGIPAPSLELDKQEGHVSQPKVDDSYMKALDSFVSYMEGEMKIIKDQQLERELKSLIQIIEKLKSN